VPLQGSKLREGSWIEHGSACVARGTAQRVSDALVPQQRPRRRHEEGPVYPLHAVGLVEAAVQRDEHIGDPIALRVDERIHRRVLPELA